ncbi:ATP-dependent endonuclease [Pseudomonas mandelii]|nr:ATP-dependent endonuclease [Pseudomonas mandelii]
MLVKIHRSISENIRTGLSTFELWNSEDVGLIKCWEVGREKAKKQPELSESCCTGELPILGWKGGVDRTLKKLNKFGSLKYLAQWQGLRNEDLNLDSETEHTITCSKTGMIVTFTSDREKYLTDPDDIQKPSVENSMHLNKYCLRNFRRLKNIEIKLQEKETIYVGANNAGKTSATAAFRLFVSQRNEFKIHDFPASSIQVFDQFAQEKSEIKELPNIELDLWFSINPDTEYGRVASFLPTISLDHTEIGIRLIYSASDPSNLISAYENTYPEITANSPESLKHKRKTLSHYLSQDENLRRHFSVKYFMLERLDDGEVEYHPLDSSEGKKNLSTLIRVDFVDAQRNIDDNATIKSNRLSQVFYDFYQHNLEKHKSDAESLQIIEQSNESLSNHYAKEFKSLISTISNLGFPSVNDRELKVISNLNPEKALSGNTALTYFDLETDHLLPEAYNGLGFKNLIFMAIQVAHFQIQWFNTENDRPLCQIIFIEEPEAHLHAQVQQTFIRKIRKVIEKTTQDLGHSTHTPQLVITTHSSHIIAEADFETIRYFRRRIAENTTNFNSKKLTSTEVLNLAKFASEMPDKENLTFLKKYLELTHCDLFFADAVIIIEGTVERILMPRIIKDKFPELESAYLTTLELGGAFAHKFLSLIKFLNLTCLIVTDLDSVDPLKNNSACIASTPDAVTSNASIKSLLLGGKKNLKGLEKTEYDQRRKISYLMKLSEKDKVVKDSKIFVSFQQEVSVPYYGIGKIMIPRTFEESFIYTNIDKVKSKELNVLIPLESLQDHVNDHETIFSAINNDFKKVEFALMQIETSTLWKAPLYIEEGLTWLCETLQIPKDIANIT